LSSGGAKLGHCQGVIVLGPEDMHDVRLNYIEDFRETSSYGSIPWLAIGNGPKVMVGD
jgi:hypothetical protein